MATGVSHTEPLTVVARRTKQPQRGPVIAAYRPLAGKTVDACWRRLPDDADHPVFVLTPT